MQEWRRMRPGFADGCRERFDLGFLAYVWGFPKRHRPRVIDVLDREVPDGRLHVIRNGRESDAFMETLAAQLGASALR